MLIACYYGIALRPGVTLLSGRPRGNGGREYGNVPGYSLVRSGMDQKNASGLFDVAAQLEIVFQYLLKY